MTRTMSFHIVLLIQFRISSTCERINGQPGKPTRDPKRYKKSEKKLSRPNKRRKPCHELTAAIGHRVAAVTPGVSLPVGMECILLPATMSLNPAVPSTRTIFASLVPEQEILPLVRPLGLRLCLVLVEAAAVVVSVLTLTVMIPGRLLGPPRLQLLHQPLRPTCSGSWRPSEFQ
jgi:hypothetical protein